MNRSSSPWMAFLAIAFGIVGLTGMIAASIAPVPLERALARDGVLDEALAVGDQPARLEGLRARLGESAGAVLSGPGSLGERVAAERGAMHARFLAEAAAEGSHLTWMIGVVTVMGAVFGAAILSFAARLGPGPGEPDQKRRNPEVEVSKTRVR